jgi:hypothetical protein
MKSKIVTARGSRRKPRRSSRRTSAKRSDALESDDLPRAVMVLGMHRSGTSALTGVINLLGADLPKSLLPPSATNEGGYWESSELEAIHDEILSAAGSKWDDWRAFNPDWYRSPPARTYKSRVLDVLRKDFTNSQLFTIKDPRICRIWPFWRDVLEEFGANPGIVIPIRNPLEVAYSLKQRNGFLPAKSCLLWLRHVLDAENATRGLPRAIVSFAALLEDWQSVVSSVGSRLGVSWPRRGAVAEVEIERRLSGRLRHHLIAPEQLAARGEVIDWVKESYSSLLHLTVTPDHKSNLAQLDRIRDEFEKASRAFGAALADGEMALTCREAEIVNVTASRDSLARHISDLKNDQLRLSEASENAIAKLREELEGALAMHSAELRKVAELTDRLRDLEEARTAAAQEAQQLASEREVLLQHLTILSDQHQRQRDEMETAAAAAKEALESTLTALAAERRQAAQQSEALEALRSEKLAAEAARADLAGNFDRASQDQRALMAVVEQTAVELRRTQDRASARESVQTQEYQSEILVLQNQLLDQEAALAYQARRSIRLLPSRFVRHFSARRLVRSGLFDGDWYRSQYPDVVQSELCPAEHYLQIGFSQGYKPNPLFDTRWYLRRYEDVRRSGVNPLLHYLQYGFREGRDPGPDFQTEFYLETNPDVRASGTNPLAHYLRHGRNEGRLPVRPAPDPGTTVAIAKNAEIGIKPPACASTKLIFPVELGLL